MRRTKKSKKERLLALRAEIARHNELYYNQDNPEISDAAYDALLQELEELEAEMHGSEDKTSPSQKVGGAAQSTFQKVAHVTPLLSLRDVFSEQEVEEWVTSVTESYPRQKTPFVVEEKVDGLSLAITYENGVFTHAATRGDGRIGEDVTENARQIDSIPKTIPSLMKSAPNKMIVRAEVIMPVDAFLDLNKQLESEGKPLMKNPRNAAAGALRVKDSSITAERKLEAVAFDILYVENIPAFPTQVSQIDFLNDSGFQVVTSCPCSSFSDIRMSIQNIDMDRDKYHYAIDGAVVKCNNLDVRRWLGETNKYPRWAVAYKYPPEQKETVVREIVTDTGRTGVITPVAVFDPVLLAGTTVTRATLHNQQFMDVVLGGIGIGDTILVHKSGEIIPEVLKVLHKKRPEDTEDFKIVACPVCGAPAVLGADENGNGTMHVCSNDNCPAKLERHLIYWCSKHVMDIAGMGPGVIRALIENGVRCIADLYLLDVEKMSQIPAIGPVRAPKLYAAIQASKEHDIDRLIAGFGIPGVGRSIGKELAKAYKNIWEIGKVDAEALRQIDGIGDISAAAIYDYFHTEASYNQLNTLIRLGFNAHSKSYEEGSSEKVFTGMTFVITGTLPSMTREEATELITHNGGKVAGSVSKKTTYLVAGEAAGSKLQKANELGIKVLSEDDLQNMLI